MADILLPRWIITNRNMPAGKRQCKKPVFVAPRQYRSYLVLDGTQLLSDRAKKAYLPKEIPNLFEAWEYRFWAMGIMFAGHPVTECRCCGNAGDVNVERRRNHLGMGGCAKKLCEAYKLLLKDNICVICDQKTTQQKWGVPLCGSACHEAWCEVETQPKALTMALALVGENVV